MPYTIKHMMDSDGERWCVYKRGPDGEPMGDTLGCHESQDKASAQIGAIEASESGRSKPRYSGGKAGDIERRDLALEVELRLDGDTGAPTVDGYAAVFNSPSEVLFEWDQGRFREKVAPGAFAKTIREQNIPLLVEHAQLPLATTGAGTLDLAEDDHGLHFRSVLDMSDPDVQRLVPKMRRGDMNRCSFGFIPIRDAWDNKAKPRVRTLHEVRLMDVSIVARPAYPATEAKVRKELADDGMDAESVADLIMRIRMGFVLDDNDIALMRRLAETLNRSLPDSATVAESAPSQDAHPDNAEQPATLPTAPSASAHPEGPQTARQLSEQWRRLERLESILR